MSLTPSSYEVQILTSPSEIAEFQPKWKEFLHTDALTPGFWQDPGIIQLNIKNKDTGKPLIITLRHQEQIVCVAPCVIEQTKFRLHFSVFSIPGPRMRILKIVDSCLVFSHDAVVEQCVSAVADALSSVRKLFDVIKLESLEENNPLYAFFQTSNTRKHFQLKITSPKKEHVWRHFLADTYDDWLKTLGNSTRRLTKRRVKKLHKEFPEQVELQKITQAADVTRFLDYIQELYPKTWQAKTFGLHTRNTTKDITFFQHIAGAGWLRSYMLLIENKPAAFLIGTQYADTFEAQEIGYDAKFSSLGVGSTLTYMILQELYAYHKPAVLSFGFGDNTYKKILCNNKTPAVEAYLIQGNFAGILIKLQILISRVEQGIRSLLVRFNLDQKIRKLLKRK